LSIGRWHMVLLVGSHRGWNGMRSTENIEWSGRNGHVV
jgi:hypothetical protein